MSRFAFFGCWNETHYPSEENDAPCFQVQEKEESKTKCDEFSSVIDEIKQQDMDFLVVAGDNYYPQKIKDKTTGKKNKTFFQTDFDKGFDALASIHKPTHLLLGNHDIENIENCKIIQEEQKRSNLLFFDYQNENTMFRKIGDHTLLILLDTNVFDPIEDFSCYSSVWNKEHNPSRESLIDKEHNPSRESLIQTQKTNITNYLSTINKTAIKNICFFGHHPLLSWKIKKEKVKLDDEMAELHSFLLKILLEKQLQDKTIYYFCAHLHQYQKGTIRLTQKQKQTEIIIHQYISGTGGGHLDPEIPPKYIDKPSEEVPYKDNIVSSYEMLESIEKNGFLDIKIVESDLLLVKFHPVNISSSSPSTKKQSKTEKTRTKKQSKTKKTRTNNTKPKRRSASFGGKTKRIQRKCKKNH